MQIHPQACYKVAKYRDYAHCIVVLCHVKPLMLYLGVYWKLRQRQHCLPQVKPANQSSLHQT